MESRRWLLRALVAKRPLAVERRHRSATPTSGQLPPPLQQLGVGGRLVRGWKLWRGAHRERGECPVSVLLGSPFLSALFGAGGICVCRDGTTPLTSPPPTPKTRSGTPVSVAGDGSATGGTKPWTSGLRWVLYCVYPCVYVCVKLLVCSPAPLFLRLLTDPLTAHNPARSIQRHQLRRLGDQWGAQRPAVTVGCIPAGQGTHTHSHTHTTELVTWGKTVLSCI